jgi:hypothetical protein
MKSKSIPVYVLFVVAVVFFPFSTKAQLSLDIESGAVIAGYNNVRIPGDTGTLFSLTDDLNAIPAVFYRLRAGYTIKSRHTVSVLYAPLTVKSDGTATFPIDFEGITFTTNTSLDASYTFNSYRITYRYDFVKKPGIEFGLGFTAKIRDAEIALESEDLSAKKTNVGFVPIINFRLNWMMNEKFGLLLEGDALAAPQGRAEDVLIAATYKILDKVALRTGYRILEGGADNDEVYNFSLFNYAVVGLSITL